MAKLTEQERLDLLEKYRDTVKEISDMEKERLKGEGTFITKKREELIQLQKAAQIQQDVVKAAQGQEAINDLLADQTRLLMKLDQERQAGNTAGVERYKRQIENIDNSVLKAQASQDKLFEATIKAAQKGIQDAGKRADIEAKILKIRQDIEDGKILSSEAEEQLEKLGEAVEDLVEVEKRLQKITGASEDAFGSLANLFGFSTGFSDKLDEFFADFKDLPIEEVFLRIGKGFTKVFNMSNLIGSLLKGAFEQVMSIANLQSSITSETGLSKEFIGSFIEAKDVANDFLGANILTNEKIMETGAAFSKNLPIFTALTKGARTEIIALGASLAEVGVDTGDMSNAIMDLMAITGDGAVDSAKHVAAMTEEFVKFGIAPGEAVASLAQMAPNFAHLGRAGIKSFVSLTKKAKALNVEIGALVKVTEVFDTFESGIPAAMNLNAILGQLSGTFGSYLDATALVMEQDPDKKIDMLREGFVKAGVSVKDLAEGTNQQRQQLKGLAESIGASGVDEFIKIMEKSNSAQLDAVSINQKLSESIKDAQGFGDLMQATFQAITDTLAKDLGIEIKDIALAIKDLVVGIVTFVKENPGLTKALLIGIPLMGTLANLATVIGPLFTGIGAAFAGAGPVILAFATGPIGIAIAAIGTLIYFFDDIKKAVMEFVDYLPDALDAAGDWFGSFFSGDEKKPRAKREMEKEAFRPGGDMMMMASGGTIGAFQQTALVGEEGPEIVTLPPGAKVYSNPESKKIAASYADGTDDSSSFLANTALGLTGAIFGAGKTEMMMNMGGESSPMQKALAKEIAKELKPVLKEVLSGGTGGSGDIYMDGKKVGKHLAPTMVKATERKMSKVLVGR